VLYKGLSSIVYESHKKYFDAEKYLMNLRNPPKDGQIKDEENDDYYIDSCDSWYSGIQISINILLGTAILYFFLILTFEKFKLYYYKHAEEKKVSDINEPNIEASKTIFSIETQNLVKVYDGKVTAVNDLTFKVKDKEAVGLLGPNGAGKSSTFNMITL
jgi:ABC-type glutathione transport system ATPase component